MIFESQEEACEGILGGKVKGGDVVIIRNEGPRGGPGMQEMLSPTSAIMGMGLGDKVALITDGRFSGGTRGLAFDPKTMSLEIVDADKRAADVLVHDETNRTLAQLLLGMERPAFPVALGVVLRQPADSFEKVYYANQPTRLQRTGRVADVLRQTSTWRVPGPVEKK